MANEEMRQHWNSEMGAAWVTMTERMDSMLAPLGLRAMDALGEVAGQAVLDIGCGCGATSASLAERGATVTGVDVSEPMLARARERTQGSPNPTYVLADAQVAPFEAEGFDGVFSRFGVMFFDDPVAAFANIRRAVRPAGRLAFVCWQPLLCTECLALPMGAVMSVLDTPPTPPAAGTPGPFAFGDPAVVTDTLTAAGWTGVEVTPFETKVLIGTDLAVTAEQTVLQGMARTLLGDRYDELAGAAAQAVAAALAPRATADGIWLGAGTWIVTASAGG